MLKAESERKIYWFKFSDSVTWTQNGLSFQLNRTTFVIDKPRMQNAFTVLGRSYAIAKLRPVKSFQPLAFCFQLKNYISLASEALIQPSLPLASLIFIQPSLSSKISTLVPSWIRNRFLALGAGALFTLTDVLKMIAP